MKIFLTVIRYMLTIVLTISILIISFIAIASSTILKKQYMLSKLEETNYYNSIYEEIKSNFEKYIDQSGLDEVVLNDIVTEEKARNDINLIIENIYDGTNKKIDVTEIKTNLTNNIEKSVENPKLLVTQKQSIDTFVDIICKEYISTMTHTQYEQNIHNYYTKILEYIHLGKQILLVSIIASVILMLVLSYKRFYKGITYIGVSFISSGIFNIILNIFINTRIKIDTITILNKSLSNTLHVILNDLVNKIMVYGGITLAVGIIIIILGNLLDSIKYKDNKHKRN